MPAGSEPSGKLEYILIGILVGYYFKSFPYLTNNGKLGILVKIRKIFASLWNKWEEFTVESPIVAR